MDNLTVVSAKANRIIYRCTGIIAKDTVAQTNYFNDRKNIGPIENSDHAY